MELILLCALLRLMLDRRWQNGESKKGWRRDADLGQLFWQQILRSPRPPLVRWPIAQRSSRWWR